MIRTVLELQEFLEAHDINPRNIILRLEVPDGQTYGKLNKAIRTTAKEDSCVLAPGGKLDFIILGSGVILDLPKRDS